MKRLDWTGAALFLTAGWLVGCDPSGTADTAIINHFDGGPDGAVEVILDGGGDPATPPDGVSACPAGICNYQTGKGCSGATTDCIPVSNGGTITPACSPPGTVGPGATCAGVTDCVAGYVCAESKCRKLCCGRDWTGCDSPDQHCLKNLEYGDGMGGTLDTGAMLCYPVNTCDALAPTSCTDPGTACLIADETGVTACLTPGAGATGDACPCQGGFVCLNKPGEPGTCHRLCKAVAGGAPPYCQDGEGVCVHFTRDPSGVGECTPM
jgi:hypothetical protein